MRTIEQPLSPETPESPESIRGTGRSHVALAEIVFFTTCLLFYWIWTAATSDAFERSADRPLVLCVLLVAALAANATTFAQPRIADLASATVARALSVVAVCAAAFLPLGVVRSLILSAAMAALTLLAWCTIDLRSKSLGTFSQRAALGFATQFAFTGAWWGAPIESQWDLPPSILEASTLFVIPIAIAALTPALAERFSEPRARTLLLALLLVAGSLTAIAAAAIATLFALGFGRTEKGCERGNEKDRENGKENSEAALVSDARGRPALALFADVDLSTRLLCGLLLMVGMALDPFALLVVFVAAVALRDARLLLPALIVGGALLLLLEQRPLSEWLRELPLLVALALCGVALRAMHHGARPSFAVLREPSAALLIAAICSASAVPSIAWLLPVVALFVGLQWVPNGVRAPQQGLLLRAVAAMLLLRWFVVLPPWRFGELSMARFLERHSWWLPWLALALLAALVLFGLRYRRAAVPAAAAGLSLVLFVWTQARSHRALHTWPPQDLTAAQPDLLLDVPPGEGVLVVEGALAFWVGDPGEAVVQIEDAGGDVDAVFVAGRDFGDWAAARDRRAAPRPSIALPAREDGGIFLSQRYRARRRVDSAGRLRLVRPDSLDEQVVVTIDRVWWRSPLFGEKVR